MGDDARLIFVTHMARESDLRDTVHALRDVSSGAPRRFGAPRDRRRRVSWPGIIEAYREHLPVTDVHAGRHAARGQHAHCSTRRASRNVPVSRGCCLKVEGLNPTGSFKDRGMTMAISTAVERGAKLVICASTGNTSASAAAYAARAGVVCAVVIPEGHVALGKLAQALIHGARVLPIRGNFDDALAHRARARGSAGHRGGQLGQPVPHRRPEDGRRSRSSTRSGDAPTAHCLPVGNAGNITAYWRGYSEYHELGRSSRAPADARLAGCGFGADRVRRARAAPRDHRHRHPHRQPGVVGGCGRRRATSRVGTSAR